MPSLSSVPVRPHDAAQAAAASGTWWARLTQTLRLWSQRAAERHQLWDLSDSDLRDMGVSRADAVAEASKPFWRD